MKTDLIRKALKRYELAVRAHEILGMHRPDDQVEIECELRLARRDLHEIIGLRKPKRFTGHPRAK